MSGSNTLPPLDITLDGDSFAEAVANTDDDPLANTMITLPDETDANSDEFGKTLTNTLVTTPEEIASTTARADSQPAEAEPTGDSDKDDWSNDEMQSTMVITPDASLSAGEKARKSGDEFVAEVKKQISSPEPIGED